jgi:hypothetical protein
VIAKFAKLLTLAGAVTLSVSCSKYVRDSDSPVRLVIESLEGASGAKPDEMGNTLLSDVVTVVSTGCSCATIFNDPGQATFRVQLRDIGTLTPSTPSPLNAITLTRYHVKYVRADGRNVQGVDVPYEFDGAATVTIPEDGTASVGFNLVRNVAKREAPLAALVNNDTLITVIAYVTFYGHDLAGNDVSVTGTIDITFANFGDPA